MRGEREQGAAWVFGYGSLVDLTRLSRFLARPPHRPVDHVDCSLLGWRRVWNVAMDNRAPGDDREAKHFRWGPGGERPHLFVTFLNVEKVAGDPAPLNGVAFRVEVADLAKLDARERRYERCEVSAALDRPLPGPVFTYVGRSSAVQRYRGGLRRGRSVVARPYLEVVEQAFRARGSRSWQQFRLSTEPPRVPVVDLVRCGGAAPEGDERRAGPR